MEQLKFVFKATECEGWPSLKFYIDDDLIEDHQSSNSNFEMIIPIDLLPGPHVVSIELYGKTPKNTKVDKLGNITQDALVELIDIYIDDIKLPEFFKFDGTYECSGVEPKKQALSWGLNGFWNWNIETPMVPWAVNFKRSHQEKFAIIDDSEPDRLAQIRERFDELSNLLDNIDQ